MGEHGCWLSTMGANERARWCGRAHQGVHAWPEEGGAAEPGGEFVAGPNCAPVRRGAKSQQHEAAEKLLRSIGLRVELFGRSKNSLAAMGLQAQSRNLL